MRGRKQLDTVAVRANGAVIKKESPNEGTETVPSFPSDYRQNKYIKKESPNEGTETGGHSASRQTEILIKKESPNEGTETYAIF